MAATYGAATFKAAIRIVDVDKLPDDINREAKALNSMDHRADARSWVIVTIERNEHLKNETGSQLAGTLLWLACTGPVGVEALRIAKQGGPLIAYEITGGEKGHGWNFRLILAPSADSFLPHMPLTPKHLSPGMPGGPPYALSGQR